MTNSFKQVIRTAETHPLTWRLRDDKQPVLAG
ncbi:NADH-quinone oxidoreductase subunit F [Providencia stuartii]|nr:NADH-quinone oxidoreductase subunit F [Providencia stuartii]